MGMELVGALRRYPDVAATLLPELASQLRSSASDKDCFQMVDAVFGAISGGRTYVEYTDFVPQRPGSSHAVVLPRSLGPAQVGSGGVVGLLPPQSAPPLDFQRLQWATEDLV